MKYAIFPAFLALIPMARAGQVLVVGSSPGQYSTIQDAVTIAHDGDVVLVKQGSYSTVRLTGKRIALVADVGAAVSLNGAVRVRDTSALQPVVVAGITVHGIVDFSLPELMSGLYASNCDGPIVVQDCNLVGSSTIQPTCPTGFSWPRAGAEIFDCGSVTISRCALTGSVGRFSANNPLAMGPGLRALSNSLVCFDYSISKGGHGGALCSFYEDGTSGGSGATLWQSVIHALGSSFRGADGVSPPPPTVQFSQVSGSGGHGIVHQGLGSSSATLLVSTTVGGSGAPCPLPISMTCVGGTDGSPVSGAVSVTTTPASFAPKLSGPNIVRDQQFLDLRVDAPGSSRVEIAVSREATFTTDPSALGILHVRDARWIRMGGVPSGGDHVVRSYALPDLPLAQPGEVLFVQARVTGPTGQRILSNVHAVVVVDAAY